MPPLQAFFASRLAPWLALPLGAALSLAFAPFEWAPLAVVCLAYLFCAWQYAAPRQAARLGFRFTAGIFLAGTYWLYNTIHEVGHAPAWIAILLMVGMVAIIGGYCWLLGYGIGRWLRPGATLAGGAGAGGGQVSLPFLLLVLPAAWTALEWFRGWFLSGFPWFALGYSQTDMPLAGFAPVGGVYTISLLVAISAGAVVALVCGVLRQRIIAAALIAVLWGTGALLWQQRWSEPVGRPLTAAIVQGAIPQDVKWSPEYRDSTLQTYRDLTLPHLGQDILLWPESALPDFPGELHDYFSQLWSEARAKGSTLITGQLHVGRDLDDIRNGLLVLDREVRHAQWYDKRRLVPFGEFFPVPDAVRQWLRLQSLPFTDIMPGASRQPALSAAGQKIGATICYEDAYGSEQLAVLQEATLLVNVTNDAWFGDTTAAAQHLQISRMRAMEARRPLLRAANDGISAIIDAHGEIAKTLPRFKPGVLTGSVQPRTGLTPYARVGNWPVISFCLLVLFAAGATAVQRARR